MSDQRLHVHLDFHSERFTLPSSNFRPQPVDVIRRNDHGVVVDRLPGNKDSSVLLTTGDADGNPNEDDFVDGVEGGFSRLQQALVDVRSNPVEVQVREHIQVDK
ncbi:hypothetical protein HPP92_015099 [Vanilla planifolia]|uniref:Uncharacterized protein n=1 Tax=Vanilla planifolia TaxID=51239 RepID=A0A835QVT6_VANPL|nr:hypothetical protein HPP92_015099 [Vanilla planifolia]